MKNHTKERILDAACDLFVSSGYTATGTREIAARAGVNESTLFRHFQNKLAMATAVLGTELAAMSLEMPMSVLSKLDLEGAAHLFVSWYAHRFDSCLTRLLLIIQIEAPDAVRIPILPAHLAMMERVAQAQRDGLVVDGDPRVMVRALLNALAGQATLRALGHALSRQDGVDQQLLDTAMILRIWLRGILR